MSKRLPFDDLIGKELPDALRNISWEGSDQQTGEDPLGNVWIRDNPDHLYLSVDSDYRERVYMTLDLTLSGSVIDGYDWFGTYASHGRPAQASPQLREAHQVMRLIKPFLRKRQ